LNGDGSHLIPVDDSMRFCQVPGLGIDQPALDLVKGQRPMYGSEKDDNDHSRTQKNQSGQHGHF